MQKAGSGKRRLLEFYSKLSDQEQMTLMAFAEFLASRNPEGTTAKEIPRDPLDIPRPERESVVAAIRRLTETYPMLERQELLNETSSLMASHVLQGRAAHDVVDELEQVFRSHYEQFLTNHS